MGPTMRRRAAAVKPLAARDPPEQKPHDKPSRCPDWQGHEKNARKAYPLRVHRPLAQR